MYLLLKALRVARCTQRIPMGRCLRTRKRGYFCFLDPVDLQCKTIFNLNMDLVLWGRCARFVASIVRLPVDQLYASSGFYDTQPAAS